MYCKRCGSALPSHGFVCKNCGAMMDSNQIREQKEHMKNDNSKTSVNLLSEQYGVDRGNLKKGKENKFLGAIIIILVLVLLIIFAILKVM